MTFASRFAEETEAYRPTTIDYPMVHQLQKQFFDKERLRCWIRQNCDCKNSRKPARDSQTETNPATSNTTRGNRGGSLYDR